MAEVTYIPENEVKSEFKVSSLSLNKLIIEANSYGEIFMISEIDVEISRGWFRKPKTVKIYKMYKHILGIEYQVIRCASGTEQVAKAFLYGYINGKRNLEK